MIPVTTITANATQDTLSQSDYLDIYNEVRQQDPNDKDSYAVSLAQFIAAIGSQYSKAAWSKYHRGELDLNRTMRSELRVGVGLAPLPPTLYEVMDNIHPDTEVVRVGEEAVNRVILTGLTGSVFLSLNEAVMAEVANAEKARVTSVTQSLGANRDRRFRPTVSEANRAWLDAQNLSADGAIDRLRISEEAR